MFARPSLSGQNTMRLPSGVQTGDRSRLDSPDALTAAKSFERGRTANFSLDGNCNLASVIRDPPRLVVIWRGGQESLNPIAADPHHAALVCPGIAFRSHSSWAPSCSYQAFMIFPPLHPLAGGA